MEVSSHDYDTTDNYISNGFKGIGCSGIKIVEEQTINHFDKEGSQSRMHRLMNLVKHYAEQRGVWKPNNMAYYWNGKTVTNVWNGIW